MQYITHIHNHRLYIPNVYLKHLEVKPSDSIVIEDGKIDGELVIVIKKSTQKTVCGITMRTN